MSKRVSQKPVVADILFGIPTLQEVLDSPITKKAIKNNDAKKATYMKEYRKRPDVKKKQADYMREYNKRPDAKAKLMAYNQEYYKLRADELKAKREAKKKVK